MKTDKLFTESGEELIGAVIISNKVFEDQRGYFYESWNKNKFNEAVNEEIEFVQDNHSFSNIGVLRGLHYQLSPHEQGKLVRCINGRIFDVIVDIRISSPTFKKWSGLELSSINKKQLWVPSGFAHGFLTLSQEAEVLYKTTGFWEPSSERSIHWNDPTLSIKWPVCSKDKIISEKDSIAPNIITLEKKELFK